MTKAEDILLKAAELKRRKSEDYQGSQFTEADYFPFGHQSFIQMLHTKYLRMRSVVEQENQNFESLEDTLIDMISYAAMYAAWLENNKDTFSKPDNAGPAVSRHVETSNPSSLDTLEVDYKRGKIGSAYYWRRKAELEEYNV